MRNFKKFIKQYAVLTLTVLALSTAYADPALISLFPLNNYDQTISTWIKPNDPGFDKKLLTKEMQDKRLDIFYDYYFGSFSPWNAGYINQLFRPAPGNDLKTIEQKIIDNFNNEFKSDETIGYGANFRPHPKEWIAAIKNNMNLSQFDTLHFQKSNRGIAVDNLQARFLPTEDVYFYNAKIPGEGYPFDNLQISAVWVGTPVYIIGETRDHVWMLVVTPEYIAWVKSRGIARTNNTFVNTWSFAAKNKLAAITRQETSILDENRRFLFTAYVGSIFPVNTMSSNLQIMVPVADMDHNAVIKNSVVSSNEAVLMPLTATPHHFANIMNALIDRPYGWGGMYLYNDCSSELKSLFTPFGIWLPRYSGDQGDAGKIVDMSSESPSNRLSYLMENGQPFLTIVYIGGHVFLYMGNYSNPHHDSSKMAMTYQNMWGLKPNPDVRRAVIGKSVLFPLLLQYPEDESLVSQANKKYFHVIYLNELPHANLLLKERAVNLQSLMNYHEK